MPRVDFYSHVSDRWAYACRLLRRGYNSGQRILVWLPESKTSYFDHLLWTFNAQSFLPHCFIDSALAKHTPILLTDSEPVFNMPYTPDILLNLNEVIPKHWQSFNRVLEIVSADGDDKDAARMRYRFYRQQTNIDLHIHDQNN
jgi:DNA polymerase III subunit chi